MIIRSVICSPAGNISRDAGRPLHRNPSRFLWKIAIGVLVSSFDVSYSNYISPQCLHLVIGGSTTLQTVPVSFQTYSFPSGPVNMRFLHNTKVINKWSTLHETSISPSVEAHTSLSKEFIRRKIPPAITDTRGTKAMIFNSSKTDERITKLFVGALADNLCWHNARDFHFAATKSWTIRFDFIYHLSFFGAIMRVPWRAGGENELHGGAAARGHEHVLYMSDRRPWLVNILYMHSLNNCQAAVFNIRTLTASTSLSIWALVNRDRRMFRYVGSFVRWKRSGCGPKTHEYNT